ncbi:Do family serine endopeptidase [Aristophania vespae]|uniref:Do family serine endopeptidase n=1 Tax=Aristophania vespae TaxID=2697033 RepID=UPI00235117E9|nr:Do family serine endopeptidase [Aristophania vespae]UMM63705.1 Periplasmic serine endoprotease DegP [Aristophania vespae]
MNSASRLSLACLATLPLIGVSLSPVGAYAQSQPIRPQVASQGVPNFVNLVKQVKPAVVSISARIKESDMDNGGDNGPPGLGNGMPFPFPFPFQMMPMPSNRVVEARGSGFLVSADGYIVTNNHVVNGAAKVKVRFDDGTVLPAKVVGRDSKTDLALLRVKTNEQLPYLELGDSDTVQPGQWVVAVGNPYGLGGTVTSGIVSALGRELNTDAYNDFIQVDAPINRGNSGGPLITLDGKVIGVNSMIMSPNGGGSIGIGFAIPSDTVKSVVDQLRKSGHVVRGYFGVVTQTVTPTMARALKLPVSEPGKTTHGAIIASVVAGAPAEKAGLKTGDVILSLNGHTVRSAHDFAVKAVALPPGSKADLSVLREGKTVNLTVITGNMDDKTQTNGSNGGEAGPSGKIGIALAAITPRTRRELGLDETIKGAVIADVAQGSIAERAGIHPGDIIVAVGNRVTTNPHAAASLIKQALANNQPPLLRILRDGQQLFVAVSPDGSDDGTSDGN